MAHQYPPGRGGTHSRGGHHAAQGRTANAYVNLFKISLDRMGKTVYQYDGESPCGSFLSPRMLITIQWVSEPSHTARSALIFLNIHYLASQI